MEIDNASDSINAPRLTSPFVSTSNAALNIADELADRERRRKNVIVYNLPEAVDRKTDADAFIALCRSVYSVDISITKILRLGKKLVDKHRLLLLSLEHDDDRSLLLTCSHLLHHNDQYKRVFIVPDRT